MTGLPIKVAVVGHTNTGKTSLLRTLLKNSRFGEVSSRPGTTRHVEGAELLAAGRAVLALYDTPGLEDSIGLLELLDRYRTPEGDGIDQLRRYIADAGNHPRFSQEAKVVRQLLDCDLIFYVADAREPVLGKYRDELKILSFAARPVIPVLNFVAVPGNRDNWQKLFSRLGLHAYVAFDTVVYSQEGEKRLYQKVQSLMESRYGEMQALIDERAAAWRRLKSAAARRVAELVAEVAGLTETVPREQDPEPAADRLRQRIRAAEARCMDDLLALYDFEPEIVRAAELPIDSGVWSLDLFDAETLKVLGFSVTSNAAKGAALGAGIDLITGGLSLGAATGIGAVAGALWGVGGDRLADLAGRIRGYRTLCAEMTTIEALWLRQLALVRALSGRGHAARQTLAVPIPESARPDTEWRKAVNRLRLVRGSSVNNGFRGRQSPDEIRVLEKRFLATLEAGGTPPD